MANAWIIAPLPAASAIASSTAIGTATNVLNDYAGVVWGSGVGTLIDLVIDLGADRAIDTLVLFGISGLPVTASATVYLDSAAGLGAFSPPIWSGAPQTVSGFAAPDSGAVLIQDLAAAPPPARYVLIRFSNGTAFSISAARAIVGKRIVLQRNFNGIGPGVKDLGALDFSARGVLLRRRGKKMRTLSLTFSNMAKDEVEASVQPLIERIGNTEMIAIVTDPASDPMRQRRAFFGPLVGELGQTWRKADRYEAKLNMVSIF